MTELQKQKQRKENILKLKKIGFWTINIFSYICAFLFVVLLIISFASPKQSNNTTPRSPNRLIHNVNEIQLVDRSPSNSVNYDDSNYTISVSNLPDNTPLTNFCSLNVNVFSSITFYVDNVGWSYQLHDNGMLAYGTSDSYKVIIPYDNYNDSNSAFGYSNNGFFTQNYSIAFYNEGLEWLNDFTIVSNSTYYESIKTAIESDLQDVFPNPNPSIFESLTSVLTNFIATLNNGIESTIELFWDSSNSSLTMLGNLTAIVVGVSLCFFLFRLVIGLIRLRG